MTILTRSYVVGMIFQQIKNLLTPLRDRPETWYREVSKRVVAVPVSSERPGWVPVPIPIITTNGNVSTAMDTNYP